MIKVPKPLTIAFDLEKMRPACILLQAAMGATCTLEILEFLFPDNWLLTPTEGMRLYNTSIEELKKISKLVTGTETTFVFEE
jgi:hypothetical protein